LRTDWGLSSRKTTDLQRFAEDIAEGDYVVLRMGTTDVLGFGVVVGHYDWNDAFGDVDGWDLQHVRRVKWLWKYKGTPETFPAYTMKLGDTVQRLDAPLVEDWIANLFIEQQAIERPLVQAPQGSRTMGLATE